MPEADILRPRGRGGSSAPPKPEPKPVIAPVKTPAPVPPKQPSLIGAYMPSLIRFLIMAGGVVAMIYGAMYFLATNVQVQPREMTEIVEIPKAGK
jgi:hypothetical protein